MISPTNLSIKTKLILIITSVSLVTLSLVLILYAYGETRHLIKSLEEEIAHIARITGDYATTDLTFKDKQAATKTLQLLQSTPNIIQAALYDADNTLFASYGKGSPYQLINKGHQVEVIKRTESTLIVHKKIHHQNEFIGSILIEVSTRELQGEIFDFILLTFLILTVMTIFSAILAHYSQRIISKPILDLSEKIKQVKESGDYSITAKKHSEDEIGKLSENINLLLASLEIRKKQRDRAEHELQQAKNILERSVYERTKELEVANSELQTFSYTVSHDLRAPLRSIDGFSKMLLDEYDDRLDAAGRDYLKRVRNATVRMGDLIDDLLLLARISQSELRHEDFDVTQTCHTIVNRLRALENEQRNIEVSIEDNMHVCADKKMMTIALENLISNALKYTRREKHAVITISSELHKGARSICIKDNGAGFDMVSADKLFTPLQRLHSPSEFEGTGIGLATVYRIVRKHDASIKGEGAPNEGACFCMTFRDKPYDYESK